MKFTVTPLGGGRGDMVRVIESIVRYLQPPPAPPPGGPDGRSPAGGGGPERYYADGGEEAGRWLGRTAAASGLTGAVQRDDFAAVLAGRDPHTGERLITAQGSAGRRPSLGAGAFSRVGNDAEPLFDVADSAAVLGVSHRELERMLDIGTAVALAAVVPTATRHAAGVRPPGAHPGRPPARLPGAPTPQPEASYLVPVIDADGSRWVSASGLSRCQTARADGVSPGAVQSLGAADDQIALAEAARLAGVTTRYLRGLARHPEQHRTEIVNALAAGRRPRKAYLVGHRGAKGRWLVTRENLAGFLERRRPPPVRVAYDLTLTTEKSLGVLALLGTEPVRAGVLDSIQAGNDWALRWIEDHAVGRIHGAAAPAEGLMVASFRHLTSRALDPFPHHHNVAAGYRVVGTAVKGEAARALAAATGIECETVAWHLAHTDPQNLPLDARTILVVDEASTLHDRALDQLMAMAAQTGASVRLVSDPAQHGAIAAGGMFRVLCERHPQHAPELTTTHRLQHPHDRAAAEALRQGRIDEAFDLLAAAGHLHVVDDDLTMYRHVLARWWDAHRAGFDHPMVDRRNSTRRQLNRLAHLLRQVNGELGADEIKASGYRQFSVGDRVTARAPNRQLHVPGDRRAHVRNGALGTVVAVTHQPRSPDGDTLTVEFDGIGIIDIPRAFFDHHRTGAGRTEVGIDHAYALTSYAVQGSTRSISTSRVDATATRAETYVDITRGRDENHLYLTAASDPLDGEALPRAPAPPADVAVADRLHRSTGELTAWGLAHPAEDTGALDRAIGQ